MKKNSLKFIATIALSFSAFAAIQSVSNYNDVANAADGSWNLVTDSSSLSVGDQVVIAASGYDFAMSTEQRSNNRGSIAVTKSGDSLIINDNVQIITLEEGSSSSYFALSTGEGYLYAASTSSNYLKTNTTKKSGSGDFSISVASTGVATIKANQSSRNLLRFNSTNNPPLFSCYTSGQADICLYEFVESSGGIDNPVVSVAGSSYIQVGETVNYEATLTNITGEVTWSSTNEDVATVSAGVVTAKTMGTTTITADVNGTSGSKEIKVYPAENTEITIGEAIEVCKLTGTADSPYSYSAVGEIISIDSEYDSGYDNVSFTISDGTNSIKCFRVEGGSDLSVGTEVKVTGKLVNYSGNTPEFIQGTTYEAIVNGKLDTPVVSFDEENKQIKWTSVENADSYDLFILDEEANEVVNTTVSATSYDVSEFANGSYSVSVVAKGNASYEPSEEGYFEFTLELTVADQISVLNTTSSLGFAYSIAEGVGDTEDVTYKFADYDAGVQYADNEEHVLDETVTMYTTNAHFTSELRLYSSSTYDGYAIIQSEKSISAIAVNAGNKVDVLNVYGSNDGETYDLINGISVTSTSYSDYSLDFAGQSYTYLKLDVAGANQIRIKTMTLSFGSGVSADSYTFSDVRMRFAATIGADVYDTLNITKAGFEVSAEGWSKSMDIDCTGKFDTDENGDYFIICSIWEIPDEAYDTVLTAKAYFEIGGTRYYAQETSYSVKTIAAAYLENSVYSTLTDNAKGAITAFNAQLA